MVLIKLFQLRASPDLKTCFQNFGQNNENRGGGRPDQLNMFPEFFGGAWSLLGGFDDNLRWIPGTPIAFFFSAQQPTTSRGLVVSG